MNLNLTQNVPFIASLSTVALSHSQPGPAAISHDRCHTTKATNHVHLLNLLTPNVNYSGRTAPLTSKFAFYIFIQQIYVLNILNTVYTLGFFLFKMQFVS